MKLCNKCHVEKPLSGFAKNSSKSDGLQARCRECNREYDKVRYASKEPGAWRFQVSEGNKVYRERNRQKIWGYLLSHPCVDCGENDPIVLEFDHVRGDKVDNVSRLTQSVSWSKVEEEIAKCDVRCANCHKRKTAKDFGWYTNQAAIA